MESDVTMKYFKYECRGHTVGMYIAAVHRTQCSLITQNDVQDTLQLLQRCYPDYKRGHLQRNCLDGRCVNVSAECSTHNAVYNTFHYLTDKEFVKAIEEGVPEPHLSFAMLILEDSYSQAMREDFYLSEIGDRELSNGIVKLVGVGMGIRFKVFVYYFVRSLV